MGNFVLRFGPGDEDRVAQMFVDLDQALDLSGTPAQIRQQVEDIMAQSCAKTVEFTERRNFQGTDEEFDAQFVPVVVL